MIARKWQLLYFSAWKRSATIARNKSYFEPKVSERFISGRCNCFIKLRHVQAFLRLKNNAYKRHVSPQTWNWKSQKMASYADILYTTRLIVYLALVRAIVCWNTPAVFLLWEVTDEGKKCLKRIIIKIIVIKMQWKGYCINCALRNTIDSQRISCSRLRRLFF